MMLAAGSARSGKSAGHVWLRRDCLERDPSGSPVLIYTDAKNNRPGRRLPISEATAAVLTAQEDWTRHRYPHTPPGDLALFPRDEGNKDGTKPIRADAYGNAHRIFTDEIAHLLLDADGQQVSPALVVPYAYRHTYAQRHADAGVQPDVLRELMSHRSMRTTTGYYRITETPAAHRHRQGRPPPVQRRRAARLHRHRRAARRRARPHAHRPGRRPVRHMHRAVQRQGRRARLAAVSRRSLLTDNANLRDRSRRIEQHARGLGQRLSELLGTQVSQRTGLAPPPDAAALRDQIQALQQENLDLRRRAEERDEELAAAREANRRLMAELNREQGGCPSPRSAELPHPRRDRAL